MAKNSQVIDATEKSETRLTNLLSVPHAYTYYDVRICHISIKRLVF